MCTSYVYHTAVFDGTQYVYLTSEHNAVGHNPVVFAKEMMPLFV